MKPKIAVHKFTSCDGCQLALLTAGNALLQLSELVDIEHFAEAGYINNDAIVDIAFIEGSISTPHEQERIKKIRSESKYLITIGACATAGGIQALRNSNDIENWKTKIYPSPQFINTLTTSLPIKNYVTVDDEIWGCPISSEQILSVIRQLLFGVEASQKNYSVCMECKQKNNRCVLVDDKQPCLGPVTRAGCGALCPSVGAACYGCYGPSELVNATAIAESFENLGLTKMDIVQRFQFINNGDKKIQEAIIQINRRK